MEDVEYNNWFSSLTQEEKDSLQVKLCVECLHSFDDNPGRILCKQCEDWAEVETTDLYV